MAETITKAVNPDYIAVETLWTARDGSTVRENLSTTTADLAVTETMYCNYKIAAGGNLTLPLGVIASCKAIFIALDDNNLATTNPTIEINNSGVTIAFNSYCVYGGAGITQIEIVNTDGAAILGIAVIVCE